MYEMLLVYDNVEYDNHIFRKWDHQYELEKGRVVCTEIKVRIT